MIKTYNINKALVFIKDGTIHIKFGPEINELDSNYHDRLVINVENDLQSISVKGCRIKKEHLWNSISEYDKQFKEYSEKLIGFNDRIKTANIFSWWSHLRIEHYGKNMFKPFKYVDNRFGGTTYVYDKKFWTPMEYKANNWVLIENKNE